ncbi:MAG: hypothetical protein JWP63_5974 [Candidatus Solibacter sp.]|nr:hypothetical protein [Candidatus Solibacter sp.]
MKPAPADVVAYIAQAPPDRQPVLNQIRTLCREILTGYEECIAYGMPGYRRNGPVELAFASQKQYIALYVMKKDVVDRHRDALPAADMGKGCIRFRRPAQIDFNLVRSLIQGTVESRSTPC